MLVQNAQLLYYVFNTSILEVILHWPIYIYTRIVYETPLT